MFNDLTAYGIPLTKTLLFIYFLYSLGFFFGLLLYCTVIKIYLFAIEKLFSCECIRGSDLLFLYEYENSPNVIIANIITNKIKINELKDLIHKEGILKFKKLRQKVFTLLGEFYWKDVDAEYALENIQQLKGKYSQRDLIAFNEEQFSIHLDLERPLWEMYLVEEYVGDDSNTEDKINNSVIIFKYHHSLGDGISLVNLLSSLAKNIDLSDYMKMKTISTWQKLLLYLLSPYYSYKVMPKKNPKLQNPFLAYSSKTFGPKKLNFTKEYSFDNFKMIYKAYPNASFNDLCWTLLCRAFIKWSNRDNCNKFTSLSGAMAVNARSHLDKLCMDNQSGGQLVSYQHVEDFEKSFETMIKRLSAFKNKETMISAFILLEMMSKYLVNDKMFKKLAEESLNQFSFLFTNVKGPSDKVIMKTERPVEVKDIIACVPHGALVFSVIAFSYNGNIRFSFTCERNSNLPLDDIVTYFEREIAEVFSLYKLN